MRTTKPLLRIGSNIIGRGTESDLQLLDQGISRRHLDVQYDGHQATAAIRQDKRFADLPIIAMTAHAMPSDREQALSVGMSDYVTKPFEPSQLFAVISRWALREKAACERDVSGAEESEGVLSEGILFGVGLQRCLGIADLYMTILRRFALEPQDVPQRIEAALQRHDLRAASNAAHSMVSTAGIIGAQALSDTARALQHAIDADAAGLVPELLNAFTHHYEVAVAQLHGYLQGHSTDTR